MQLEQFYNIATKVSSRKKCYYFCWSTWLIIKAHNWLQLKVLLLGDFAHATTETVEYKPMKNHMVFA